jgi:N-acetylated-alpha-linked acidic dipeptidase
MMYMHTIRTAGLAALTVTAGLIAPGALDAQAPTGFAPAGLEAQQRCETRFLELPRPDQFREHLRTVTAAPHPTGSAAQLGVAAYLVRAMEAAGFTVEQPAYDVYLPLLDSIVVEAEIVSPAPERLVNREPAIDGDAFSSHPGLMPAWNAFSGSGDVTAEVVYANMGRKEDFEQLDALGVDVRGKIVIARYGGNFRGYKVKFAEQWGAAGVIMFNDPGFASGGEYPEGPNMTPFTVQRGSVLTLDWTGDPLTPFEPALPDGDGTRVERLDPATIGLHTIPVLPLGHGPARQILERMQGAAVPAGWGGGMAVPYRLTGGADLKVRVHVEQPKGLVRAVNVIGTLRGSEYPDEWIILGSHYDPWGFGAIDPNGGTAMLLTLADALGMLAREGCAPRRSIMIAHWDAEEYGIIGSTEWVEHFRDDLSNRAVAYINADASVSGPTFSASSSPSLKQPILDAARAVAFPDAAGSVFDVWARGSRGSDPALGDLGGGSDHVAFYTHIGVPSAGLSLGGSNGVYHSNYDNFAFFSRFSDPEFVYGPTLAKVDGILALRLANADVLPYDIVRYGSDTEAHAIRLEALAKDRGLAVRLDSLKAAVAALTSAAHAWVTARDDWLARGGDAAMLARINSDLIALEKALLYQRGLQDRPWSRSLYASPDPFSGYASWMLPGLRYEIETDDVAGVGEWEQIYISAIRELERRVTALTARIKS